MDSDNKINEGRDPRTAPNEPPDRGSLPPAPADAQPGGPPSPELPASQSGRWPTHDAPPRSLRR